MSDREVSGQTAELRHARPAVTLSVRSLSHRFGGLLAVDALDLEVRRGTVHALIGPNGAGKSTAVNLLSGMLKPDAGHIALDGIALAGQATHRMAQAGVVRTFQNGRLFARLSVLENVLIGADCQYRASLLSALSRSVAYRTEEARMRETARTLLETFGMAADAGRPVSALPYGKQRKLEMARALILQPKVLLLDEPAAGLNSAEVENLIELIDGLRQRGLTIVLIEHNMGLVMRLADRIAVLNFGKKIAEGTPQEISCDELVIEAYLGRKATHARL